ncbi:hypothetical protein Taro_022974 [Colocasia esculenta]|uniref:Uncharacterized protein n=1 Tax=Colocasia esculenta TaxID=4460 RepID=A0A843V9G4_COLES|nr:hypothetical protein [Colocasia esculenta]
MDLVIMMLCRYWQMEARNQGFDIQGNVRMGVQLQGRYHDTVCQNGSLDSLEVNCGRIKQSFVVFANHGGALKLFVVQLS